VLFATEQRANEFKDTTVRASKPSIAITAASKPEPEFLRCPGCTTAPTGRG
jgi:hypothetical protein